MTIVNVYAPTSKPGLDVKTQFYDDLQRTLDSVPERDILIVLGDFNARIGISDAQSPGDDVWSAVRGSYGLGLCNEAGRRLLMWCAVDQLSAMNTWFEKPEYKRGTWCHPATKQFHLIDMIIVRQSQRVHCKDVSVVHGPNCFNNHRMVRGKLYITLNKRREARCVRTRPIA
eukprot:scpid108656/ scgid20279/ Craniofacial development protein 2; p97 bucentaur protein